MSDKLVSLYLAMRDDDRLQREWQRNQPRRDRALESPLIAMTTREVATACLQAIKLRFHPDAVAHLEVDCDSDLLRFARTQKSGGGRLANIIEDKDKVKGKQVALAAAIHTLEFYRDRSAPNELVRLEWSDEALKNVSNASADEIINPHLKPTHAARKALAVKELSRLLIEAEWKRESELRTALLAIQGLGPERADAAGLFGFEMPWPIVDEYLWRLLARHSIISHVDASVKGYVKRRRIFDSMWSTLSEADLGDGCEVAATLYLWADEAEKFGYKYW